MFYKLIMKKMILTLILVISFTNFAFAKSYSLSAINNVRSMWRYSTSTDWKSLNTVKFGRWDQVDNNAFDDIEWLVVKKEKGKALLLSKYCLEKLKFHKSNRDKKLTWATSDLRKILNTTFYDRAFNDEEKANILNTEVSLDGKIYSDNTVTDKVFILSESELFHYCGNFYESKNKFESAGTPVANTMGTFSVNSYWLRTPGGLSNDFYKDFKIFDFAAITTGTTPSIDVEWENGVRPAIWVKAESSLYDEEIDHNWWKTENNNNDIQKTSSEITNANNNNQLNNAISGNNSEKNKQSNNQNNKKIIEDEEYKNEIPSDNTYSGPNILKGNDAIQSQNNNNNNDNSIENNSINNNTEANYAITEYIKTIYNNKDLSTKFKEIRKIDSNGNVWIEISGDDNKSVIDIFYKETSIFNLYDFYAVSPHINIYQLKINMIDNKLNVNSILISQDTLKENEWKKIKSQFENMDDHYNEFYGN